MFCSQIKTKGLWKLSCEGKPTQGGQYIPLLVLLPTAGKWLVLITALSLPATEFLSNDLKTQVCSGHSLLIPACKQVMVRCPSSGKFSKDNWVKWIKTQQKRIRDCDLLMEADLYRACKHPGTRVEQNFSELFSGIHTLQEEWGG